MLLLETKRLQLQIRQQRSTVKSVEKCIGALEKMRSRKFNDEQCDYLVDKLKVVTQRANVYLDRIHAKAYRSNSDVNVPGESSLKCLPALTIQITSFVERCCKDAWLPVAVTLTNTAEYVSSIGFDLELCRVDFCREGGSLTPDQVLDINKAEFEIVRKKAASDVETLLARVRSGLPSFRGGKKDLANYLLQRLSRIQANEASFTSGSSFWGANHEKSLWTRLFKWVKSKGHQIGKGSAATVHKTTWLGIQVAKKTFIGHENPDFMKEVGILGKLCHPNITSMFCCAKDIGNRWCAIIMELMDGDLHDLMLERCRNSVNIPFSILEGVDIMHQIGEGVKYLHAQRIVHRDLKSFNILVKVVKDKGFKTEHVHAKVADFGLSKTKESSIRYSNQTCNTGSNRWMAPEIIRLNGGEQGNTGTKPKYPFKCDVYSYAMVCYEILTGYEPFYEERSLSKVKEKVLKGKRPHLPDHCPSKLKALIERCWAQVPEERPSFNVICLELKYLKYLLMTGSTASSSTSTLKQYLGNSACTTSLIAASSSQLLGSVNGKMLLKVEEVPDGSKQGTELTAESTPTATMMPKVKGAEDQFVKQDDPFSFQDVATMLGNQDETVVLSGSDISSQNEGEGGDQGKGGINSGGTVSPPTRSTSNRCREPSILYESQPTKRFRLGTNESPARLATGVTSALNVDHQRELVWTKLQVLKDQYLGDMNELYGLLSNRLTKPMPVEHFKRLKIYKDVLHRLIPYLRVRKERIPKEFTQDKLVAFEEKIVEIMDNMKKRR